MLEEQLLELHGNSGIQGFLTKPLFESRLKLYTFGFFGKLFKLKYSHKIKPRHQFTLETTINLILMLQLISMTWYPNYKITGWESYSLFWKILGIVSYDELCFEYGAQDICFYGTIGLIVTCIICFVVFGVFIYIKKEPPGIITALPRKISMALTTICFIPSFLILLMVFKYSVVTKRETIEYGNKSRNLFDYGIPGGIISIILLIFLVLIKFFSEIFTCDIRHSRAKENLKARCCSDADLNRFGFYVLNCLLYVSLGDYQIEYQIILFSISTYIFFQTLNYMPYYNFIENSIQAVKLSAISGFLLIFLFGEILDNSLIILWMNIFIQPLIFYFVIRIVKHLYENLSKGESEIKNQYEFERKFRHLLVDKRLVDKENVLDLFSKFSKGKNFYRSKLFVVWEFNFCLYVIKDERLARVKLSKIAEIPSTFEGDAQEWRLFNWLIDKKCANFADTNYLEYLTELNRVKTKDEELCCILVELRSEFASKVPRLPKLLNLANQVDCHIEEIKEEYKNVVEKYKNIETFELYGSFLENILKDHEEALIINRKKHGINLFNMRGDDKKLEKYGKENGTLLISASSSTFGNVVFLNEKAAQILKTSIIDTCGITWTNFIPPPYNIMHQKLMKKYFCKCHCIDIPYHKSLPLLTRNGYIKECNVLLKLTAFHNHAYFLLSFREKNTSREAALISEDGQIYCHSELFAFLIGIEAQDVRNKYISELLPMLDFENMEPFEPWLLPFEDKELAVIHTIRNINSKTLHFLILVHDEKEVKRWKEGHDLDQIEFLGNSAIIDDYDEPSQIIEKRLTWQASKVRLHTVNQYITSISKSTIKEESEIPTQLTNLAVESKEIEDFDDKSGATSVNGSNKLSARASNFYIGIAQRLIISSKKKIRVLQLVLFFTILSVIIGVIAILSYMVSDVSHTTSLTIFTHLGQLLYDLSISSDLARVLHKEITLGLYKQTNRLADVQALVTDLRSVQQFIFADLDQWSYCSSSDVVMKPIIPAWNLDKDKPELIKENLYNIVDKFILNWENLILAVNRNESYIKYVKYIVINSVDFSYEYSNYTMQGLVDCEIEKVDSFGTNITVLLVCGIFALIVFFTILIGFIIMANKSYNSFWNFMLNHAQVSLIQLKREAIDRLFAYHGIDYKSETVDNEQRNANKHSKIKTDLNRKYIGRILIFVVIALTYYLLMYYYLYTECKNSMINRPKLLSNFNIRRALLTRISFFAKDIYTPYLYQNFKDLYGYSNSYTMLDRNIALFDEKIDELQSKKYQKLMSKELLDRIYEKTDSDVPGLHYGSAAANHAAIFEARYITKMFPPNNTFMIIYINFVNKIEVELGSQFMVLDKNSKDLINSQLSNIIICTVCYSICLCFLFFFYYFPYLNNEVKQFSRLLILPHLLPMEDNKRMQAEKFK